VGNDITEALRNEVARRAHHRCEYCLIHEDDIAFRPHVDHIVSRKHGGLSDIENLAYACVTCNRSKGSDVASIDGRSGEIVRLFHPRQDQWADHFQLDGSSIRAVSDVGGATLELLKINAPERLAERSLLQTLGSYPTKG
jgi:HNH endonuclease